MYAIFCTVVDSKCAFSIFYRLAPNVLSLSNKGQSSPPTYETVPGTYEEIPATSRREVKGHYKYTQNEAYVTATMSESGHGN